MASTASLYPSIGRFEALGFQTACRAASDGAMLCWLAAPLGKD